MSSGTDAHDLVTSNSSSNYALYVASASGLLSSSISNTTGSGGNGNHVTGGGNSASSNGASIAPPAMNTNSTTGVIASTSPTHTDLKEKPDHLQYLKDFRVDQCPNFLQHKCTQHKPYTCFKWHFQNQRRRRPAKRRDGQFNYSPDVYCSKYDETTGICEDGDDCPYLHRTSGDTERRYHLRYYKTGICVYDTDSRGYCVKNGQHCAFAHGIQDLRSPVYDVRELQAIDSGLLPEGSELNSLEKERNAVNEDPRWNDSLFVLINYKTDLCKRPPRICRQGYACPQYHNSKDKRRSPKKFKYRSTPCPNVKQGDEWGDPGNCESGEGCSYCHTRTEQQFHPEIYKSTKCYDILQTSYCPRGPFCAFAHNEKEMHLRHELTNEINSDSTTSKSFSTDLLSASSATSHYTGSFPSNGKTESSTSAAAAAAGATCSSSCNNNNNNNNLNHSNNNNNGSNGGQLPRASNPLSVSGVNLNNNHQSSVASSLPDRYGINLSSSSTTTKLDLAGSHFAEAGIIRNLASSLSTDPGPIAPPRLRSATNPPLMQRLTSNNTDSFSRRQSSGFLSSPPFHSTLFPRSDTETISKTTTIQDDPSQPAYWDEYFRDESNNSTLNGGTTNDSRFERPRDTTLCGSAPVNIPSSKRDPCFPFGNGLSISPTSSYGISPFPRNPPSSVDPPLFLGSASPPSHRAMVVEAAAYSIEIQRLKDELSRVNEELAEYQKIVSQQNQVTFSLPAPLSERFLTHLSFFFNFIHRQSILSGRC